MRIATLLCVGLVIGFTFQASGETVYDYAHPFASGSDVQPSPEGTPPWLSATFTDIDASTIRLRLSVDDLPEPQFVVGFYFNFNPTLDPSLLNFDYVSGVQTATEPEVGTDAFKASGDGLYDIYISFPTANNGLRFTDGEYSEYDICYNGTLPTGTSLVDQFHVLATPDGGYGPYYTAGRVQGLPNEQSTWLYGTQQEPGENVVPEPSSVVMLLVLAGLSLLVRRR